MAELSASIPKPRRPRGFEDRDAGRIAHEARLAQVICEVYRHWGYDALDTAAFEYVDALGKFLPDADRPNAGVFALRDDDQWLALRYDHTAPLARYVAENSQGLPRPFRRYVCGPVWRNEKPGPLRFREFIQCDADAVGIAGIAADAEMAAMAAEVMAALGCEQYLIRVNTRRLTDALLRLIGAENPCQRLTIMRALDKLDRLGEAAVADLLGSGRRDESGDFTEGAGLSLESVDICLAFLAAGCSGREATLSALSGALGAAGEDGLAELAEMDKILSGLGYGDSEQICFDPSVVRGLEYYTGPVLEAELRLADNSAGAVGGGGRYDDLVSRFGGDPVPATGFSFGVSRLAALVERKETGLAIGPVVVLVPDREHMSDYCAMAAELRAAGIRAETYLGRSGLRAQFKYADRRRAPAVVIVGSDERARNMVTIKDLRVGAEAAAKITDNRQWRQERPGQSETTRANMTASIRAILEQQA